MDMALLMSVCPHVPSTMYLRYEVSLEGADNFPEGELWVGICRHNSTSQGPRERPWFQKECGQSDGISLVSSPVTADLTEAATLKDSSVLGYSSMAGRFAKPTCGATCKRPLTKKM